MSAPILSRFDNVFVILDECNDLVGYIQCSQTYIGHAPLQGQCRTVPTVSTLYQTADSRIHLFYLKTHTQDDRTKSTHLFWLLSQTETERFAWLEPYSVPYRYRLPVTGVTPNTTPAIRSASSTYFTGTPQYMPADPGADLAAVSAHMSTSQARDARDHR